MMELIDDDDPSCSSRLGSDDLVASAQLARSMRFDLTPYRDRKAYDINSQ